jgi:hypothetical protein
MNLLDPLLLSVCACLLALAIYYQRRDLSLGLLAGLVALSVRALVLLERKVEPVPDNRPSATPPEVIEGPRTADEVAREVEQDDRSPTQLELDLEREFGHRPRDAL